MIPRFAQGTQVGFDNNSDPTADLPAAKGKAIPITPLSRSAALWILDAAGSNLSAAGPRHSCRQRLSKKESIIDLISLIFAAAICELAVGEVVISDDDTAWRDNVAALLASLRTDDGGFAKTPEGRAGSTYQTFLSVLVPRVDRSSCAG